MFPTPSSPERFDLPPAVVVHGLDDACAALAPGLPVTLLSAPAAALFAGAGWWRAVVSAARAAHPAAPCRDVLDCADAPGRAMEAIRIGQRILVLSPECPAFARVAGLAVVLPHRPAALDLGRRGAVLRLCDWLKTAPEDDTRPALR